MKGKQTYTEWSGFHWARYFLVNGSRLKGPLLDMTTLHLTSPCREWLFVPYEPIHDQHLTTYDH
jgi:hypothetical protein